MSRPWTRTGRIAFALAATLYAAVPAKAQESLPSPAIASGLDSQAIDRLAASIRADASSVDRLGPAEAVAPLRSAVESLAILEAAGRRPADERGDPGAVARRHVADLASSGIDRQSLTAQLVDLVTREFETTGKSGGDLVSAFADLDRMSLDIVEPLAKARALASIGRLHRRLGNAERAARYGQLVERATRDAASGPERDAVLAEALALIGTGEAGRSIGLAVAILSGFSDPANRAAALSTFAASQKSADGTLEPVFAAIATSDRAATALLLKAAVASGDDDLAALLASASADAARQIADIEALATAQLAGGRALAALDTARLLPAFEKAKTEAAVAADLAHKGYAVMARGLIDRIGDGAEDPAIAALRVEAAAAIAAPRRHTSDQGALAVELRRTAADPVEGERAAIALSGAARDLSGSLEIVRRLTDDRLRVAAFRAIAETAARRLDPAGPAAALAGRSEYPSGTGGDLYAAAGLRLVAGDLVRSGAPEIRPGLPDLSASADTVRAKVPLPRPGVSELSLAGLNRFTQLNRFNSKFLEDVVGTTAREHIFRTQGTINPTFIYLTEGVFSARDLLHSIDTSRSRQLERRDGAYTLRVPLVIGQDATLILSGVDAREFRLSADAGAFIVNAGRLYVVDTDLVAWSEAEAAPAHATYEQKHEFRPFITAWSGSETYIAGSVVTGLGYSAGKSYGLTFSSGPEDGKGTADRLARPTGILVDSLFRNLYYGFYTYEADDIAVVGNIYEDNVVYGLDPHDRSRRLAMAYNTLYGTQKKHGAIFSRDVHDSLLYGNVSFANAGSGFMMDRRSTGNLIRANTGIGNDQDGMTVYESPCVDITLNRFEANRRSGVKIRNSWTVVLESNRIVGNTGPAIEGYVADLTKGEDAATRDFHEDPFLPITSFSASGTLVSGNGGGITARGVSAVGLSGTRFVDQGVRFFDGDLKAFRVDLLRAAGPGAAATVVPSDLSAPSTADTAEAGTPACPPPGRRPDDGSGS